MILAGKESQCDDNILEKKVFRKKMDIFNYPLHYTTQKFHELHGEVQEVGSGKCRSH